MKKALLFFVLLSCAGAVSAQTCSVDSTILQTGGIISPPPTSTTYADSLPDACLNQPYSLSFTINVPTDFSGIPINDVTIATTGAVTGLPTGLGYSCNPPNCVFPGGSLGCILVYGTVAGSNPVKTYDLGISGVINTSLAPITFTFPGAFAPGNYYLEVKPAGTCVSATGDLSSPVTGLKNTPNPFGAQTFIEVESRIEGMFQFEVFDLLGQRVYADDVHLYEGSNKFTFDAGDLASGSYFYSVGNREGKTTKMLVVTR